MNTDLHWRKTREKLKGEKSLYITRDNNKLRTSGVFSFRLFPMQISPM